MLANRFNNSTKPDESGTWLSVGDLMSVALMIFALLLVTTLVKITEQQEEQTNQRVVIITALGEMLKESGIEAEINQETGDISIMDSVLFDLSEHELREDGQSFLDNFVPHYARVIFETPGASEEIVRVIIEGHTSSSGSENANMLLSLRRANSVYKNIDHKDFDYKYQFLDKLLVAGRGEFNANQENDERSDRKVMFRLQFKGLEKLHTLFDLK
ncbi:OmpA family protein [Thalassotalea ponticola]|uniref:OmpA/MotB family protein n=1 Tax=Thalassotalea ponticola TaxID=1523392 RepID=UPI0025B493E5|nr:OmpA family protein [Thalassotalea ponticola]MDN3652758.1 OmpA family protein [Thalassotalea ponticola]